MMKSFSLPRVFTGFFAACVFLFVATDVQSLPDGIQAEQYADGLLFPVAMTVTPDGDILVTEKFGTIRLVRDGQVLEDPVASFEVKNLEESGLLGIELLPDFETNREFAVTYTPERDLTALYVTRLRLNEDGSGEVLEDPWLELPSRAEIGRHFGGNIRFTEDHFFVALSDALDDSTPQDLSNPFGTILRYNLDLTIPEDNPFGADSPIYVYGLRNCFDFDISPEGRFYCAENGPSLHDHINKVEAGRNFGWPHMAGYCDGFPLLERCEGLGFTEPAVEFGFRVGPTGVLIYDGDLMPQFHNDVFMGGWHSGELHRTIPVDDDGEVLEEDPEPFFILPAGPFDLAQDAETEHLDQYGVTDVAVANDGAILVLESGIDRGSIYRIAPADQMLDPDAIVELGTRRLKNQPPPESCSTASTGPGSWLLLMAMLLGLGIVRRRRLGNALAGSILCALAATAVPNPAEAQEIRFGGFAGPDITQVTGRNSYMGEWGTSWAAGAVSRLSFGDFFAVQPELLFATKGSGLLQTDDRLNLRYLMLPVTAVGMLPVGPVNIRLHGGVAGSYLLDASVGEGDRTDKFRSFEFSVLAGLGTDFDFGLPVDFTFDGRYERGISPLADKDAAPEYVPFPAENVNNVVYLLVGALY